MNIYRFQPTRPLRGATAAQMRRVKHDEYFNPRAPCGARRPADDEIDEGLAISTHAPLAGRDGQTSGGTALESSFQPTRPLRGATPADTFIRDAGTHFNPRAPCGARQASGASQPPPLKNFNPRAPCGARRTATFTLPADDPKFQPTRPLRGATDKDGKPHLR